MTDKKRTQTDELAMKKSKITGFLCIMQTEQLQQALDLNAGVCHLKHYALDSTDDLIASQVTLASPNNILVPGI